MAQLFTPFPFLIDSPIFPWWTVQLCVLEKSCYGGRPLDTNIAGLVFDYFFALQSACTNGKVFFGELALTQSNFSFNLMSLTP